MKKIIKSIAILLVLGFVLISCTPKEEVKPAGLTEEEIKTMAADLIEKGGKTFWWYMDSGNADLLVENDDDYTNPFKKVGRFSTIAELKAATEEVYTVRFCEEVLYPTGFNEEQGENIKFKEIDGELYTNLNNGGMGWPFDLKGDLTVISNTAEEIIVEIPAENMLDGEETVFQFKFVKTDGGWRLDNWFDFGTVQVAE